MLRLRVTAHALRCRGRLIQLRLNPQTARTARLWPFFVVRIEALGLYAVHRPYAFQRCSEVLSKSLIFLARPTGIEPVFPP